MSGHGHTFKVGDMVRHITVTQELRVLTTEPDSDGHIQAFDGYQRLYVYPRHLVLVEAAP